MLDPRRRAYLAAMGIDLWQARQAPAEPVAQLTGPASQVVVSAAPERLSGDMDSPVDWPTLAEHVAACRQCALGDSRTQTVFGTGKHEADLLVVGAAPGAEEERLGEPFVGEAGQLLSAMLRAIGLQRHQVYLTNMLKCRPSSDRAPQRDEITACQGYLNQQIGLLQPKLILALGAEAACHLLNSEAAVSELRSKTHQHPATATPVLVTYHPDDLLRQPEEKAKAWVDLQRTQATLSGTTQ